MENLDKKDKFFLKFNIYFIKRSKFAIAIKFLKHMKIDNKSRVSFIFQLIYTVIFTLLVVGGFLNFLAEERIDENIPNETFLVLLFIILIIVYYLGPPIFFYDSLGETTTIKNRTSYPMDIFNSDIKYAEFPKRKIKGFKVVKRWFFKKSLRLILQSNKSNSGRTAITYNITYLTKREINDLKISLTDITKENKDNAKFNQALKQKFNNNFYNTEKQGERNAGE